MSPETRNKFEEWKKKVQERTIKDEETIKQYMISKAVVGDPFRLEILQDTTDSELIFVQGNKRGLTSLRNTLDRLINTNTVGGHAHFEDGHGLSKANVSVIVQLVDDDEKNDSELPHLVK